MFVITHRKWFFLFSAVFVVASWLALASWGLNLGIDFTGGTLIEVEYTGARPTEVQVREALTPLLTSAPLVQSAGEKGIIIKTKALSEPERVKVTEALQKIGTGPMLEKRLTSIGPSIGKELRSKALLSITLVVLLIISFIAFSFRHVSEPVRSWKYGLIAIVALIHDISIPTGLFAVLGHFYGAEVDTLFVTALLAILGLSVSDTIVVFDRIRENLRNAHKNSFEETIGGSLSQVFTRSINTSVTVLLAVIALYFFGPDSTRFFALTLGTGLVFGTYSSIFIASPLLVVWENWSRRGNIKSKK